MTVSYNNHESPYFFIPSIIISFQLLIKFIFKNNILIKNQSV